MKETYVKLSDIRYQNFVLGPGMLVEAAPLAVINNLTKYEFDTPDAAPKKKRAKKGEEDK